MNPVPHFGSGGLKVACHIRSVGLPRGNDSRQQSDDEMDVARLGAIWRGETGDATGDDYADAAITGTLAVALELLGRAPTLEAAQAAAQDMWRQRDRKRLLAVA